MPKYLSGRVKRTPQGSLTTDRYQYLGLDQAEPNLGDPPNPLPNAPGGSQFQIISWLKFCVSQDQSHLLSVIPQVILYLSTSLRFFKWRHQTNSGGHSVNH